MSPASKRTQQPVSAREAEKASDWQRATRESGRGRSGNETERQLKGSCNSSAHAQSGSSTPERASGREQGADRLHHTHARAVGDLPTGERRRR